MKSPEEKFIKSLKDYFYFYDEIFNDVNERKILSFLENYKSEIKENKQIVEKSYIVYRTAAQSVIEIVPKPNKSVLHPDEMEDEFRRFCESKGIVYKSVKKNGRGTKEIKKIRTDFCNYVAENYLVSKSELAQFFNLNHASIHYYFNSSKNEGE